MKKWWIVLAAAALALLISSCTKSAPEPENPQDVAEAYLADWQKLSFDSMYDLLSDASKAKVPREDFAKRYQTIYDGIGEKNLTVTGSFPAVKIKMDPKAAEASFPYHVKMDSAAGPIEFDSQAKLTKVILADKDKTVKWFVEWSPASIFPQLAEGDKVRVQALKTVRGEITDRGGFGLAVNGKGLQLGIIPGKLGTAAEQTKAALAAKLNLTVDEINKKLNASWVKPDLFVPITVLPENAVTEELNMPGVDFLKTNIRSYPYGEAAAHLTGYIGEISTAELAQRKDKGYAAGDLIGKTGLEQVFEDRLRGKDGIRIYLTDAAGKDKGDLARIDAVPGETIKLTIDVGMQMSIYNEMKQDAGSAAAVQPGTGEVLALVSSPSYDPNAFVRGISAQQFNTWNTDPLKPFLNRFTKDYAPGSSFKLIAAALALDGKTLDPNAERTITGLRWTKDASWGNYYVTRVHDVNPVNLQQAITNSDNIYFAQVALELGKAKLEEGAKKFGIGEPLPLPYPFNLSQLSNKGIKGETQLADTGYGQGEVTMTSLHLALVYSAFVNGGNIASPSLTIEADSKKGSLWKPNAMSTETAELLKNDLIQAVADPAGTGHGALVPGMQTAGKTGTAELKASKAEEAQENGWFVGFNAASPKIVLSMMIESVKGRGGSGYIAAKAKNVLIAAEKQLP